MKIICAKDDLTEIISTVQKAVSVKAVNPILECIKIDAFGDGRIMFTANNLDICIEFTAECTVDEPGTIALSSRMFGDIIRRLSGDEVDMHVNPSNNVTTIKCGKSEFNIQGLDSSEYPAVPEIAETYRFSLTQGKLKKILRKTLYAVSQNEARKPILTGANFEIDTGVLSVVTTDTYRLAIIREVVDSSLEPKSFVVPGATLREILKVLKDGDDRVEIIVSDRHVMFNFDTYRIITRLLDGKYINYRPVLNTPNSITVRANARDLTDSLERAALIIDDDMTAKAEKLPVILNIASDKVEITCMTGRGKVYDAVEVNTSGNDLEIGFNHKLLLDALRACDDDEIKLEFSNPRSSCFITSENDDSYTFMVLPVRLYNN